MLRRSDVEQKSDIIVAASSFSTSKGPMMDHEGLIPVPTKSEFYFVVDCPSLHIVSGNNIGPRWQSETDVSLKLFMYSILIAQDDLCSSSQAGFSTLNHALCPQCRFAITRTRQIMSTSGTPTPGLDAPVDMLDSGEVPRQYSRLPEVNPIQTDPSGPGGNISALTLSRSKLRRIFKMQTAPKPPKAPKPAKSVASSDNQGSTLPRFLSFCFSFSGKSLILWKKDSPALVRVEVESRGSRLLDLTAMLPVSDEVRAVNIRNVVEGNDWICALISHNQVCCI